MTTIHFRKWLYHLPGRSALLFFTIFLCPVTAVSADSLPAETLETVRRDLQSAVDSLLVLVSRPVIAGGTYKMDQELAHTDISILRFPFSYTWNRESSKWRPLLSASVGRLTERQEIFLGEPSDISHFEVRNVVLGAGAEVQLPYNFTLTPLFSVAYSHVKNNFEYRSKLLQLVKPYLSGTLYDWSADTISYFPSLKLEWNTLFNELEMELTGSFAKLYTHTLNPPSHVQDFKSDSGVLRFGIELTHPRHIAIAEVPLALGVFSSRNDLYGDAASGSHVYFYESGLILKANTSKSSTLLSEVSCSISGIWGSTLTGINVGVGFDF